MKKEEIAKSLQALVRGPAMCLTPEHAEGTIVSLLEVLVAMERDCSFPEARTIVGLQTREIRKALGRRGPEASGLCHEQVRPKWISSYKFLRARCQELCRSVLSPELAEFILSSPVKDSSGLPSPGSNP